jgi:hypothetical protein
MKTLKMYFEYALAIIFMGACMAATIAICIAEM